MIKKYLFLTVVVLVFLLWSVSVLAHQPRIVKEARTEIKNPEISQAFYGQLSGGPDFYEIKSEKDFNFYFGLLVPDLPNQKKNFSARIVKRENGSGRVIYVLDGLKIDWQPYFEKFSGDSYFKGPNWRQRLSAGEYSITVWSPENDGKYVLVVGEKESFSLNEIINTFRLLPKLKKDFFEKSSYLAFFNLFGLIIIIVLLALSGLIVGSIFLFKKLKKQK